MVVLNDIKEEDSSYYFSNENRKKTISKFIEKRKENKLELLLLEKTSQLEEMKLFLGSIVHDVCSPLGIATGTLDLLLDDLTSSQDLTSSKAVSDVRLSLEALGQIQEIVLVRLRNVLSYQEKFDKLSQTNLVYGLEDHFNSYSYLFDKRGIKYNFSVENDRIYIPMNSEKFKIILTNLTSNSLQHLPEYGGKIHVDIDESDSKKTILYYGNSSPAIPKEISGQIFSKGFSTSSDKDKGKGLYLVSRIMSQCGGHIDVVPDKDFCEFRLSFPRFQ